MSEPERPGTPAGTIRRAVGTALVLFGVTAAALRAQNSLFYLELQAVGAFSTASDRFEGFSFMAADVMQKPGAGFDFVQRLSGKSQDIGSLAVQARLAYDESGHKLEPQLYNAVVRFKPRFANVWIGHGRPAMGLASVLDNHALLLPDPTMFGSGFERDWGAGLERDFAWGGVAASLTAGSGMPLRLRGNYLAAARLFKGVLARDNYSLGLSLAHGQVLEVMGYRLLEPEPSGWTSAGLDVSSVWRNVENRAEVLFGRRGGNGIVLLFWRAGLSFLGEGRLKVEMQPVLARMAGDWRYALASGLTYLLTADLAGRFMVLYDQERRDARFAVQLYFYKRL